jgi:hypothetical protein
MRIAVARRCLSVLAFAFIAVPAVAVGPDAVGGGYAKCGVLGEYFANADLSGTPVFSRRDVRIDFDWGTLLPIGGSRYTKLRTFPRDNFSVRWTGQLIPRFSEGYVFKATCDEGVRVRIKAAGSATWNTIIDQWNASGTFSSASQALTAGSAYDIQVEYHDLSGAALCRLAWWSHSTPEEVIDAMSQQALNAASWPEYCFADLVKGRRWDNNDSLDSMGCVTRDNHEFVLGEMYSQDIDLWGTYRVSFKGKARVTTGCCNTSDMRVGATDYVQDKPRDAGYNAATNTTTFTLRSDGSRLFPRFLETSRSGGTADSSGITELHMMRPLTPKDSACHDSSEVIYRPFKQAVAEHYTCLRWLQGANGNTDSVWNDRTRPGYAFFSRAKPGVYWSDQENWEYLIMLSNETGKDLYLTLPIKACDDYFAKLANLLKYGSDGNQPYTSPQVDPEYPPLNPNLRVYMEVGNEIWNWAFRSTQRCRELCIEAATANNAVWQTMNYDGVLTAGDGGGIYGMRRWLAIRAVSCSNAFRSVYGDAGMGAHVRMLTEYQYDDAQETAGRSFQMFNEYYNNGKGSFVATPHPANYYLWGAGGATYYGVGNSIGAQSAILVPDSGFETPAIGAGTLQAAPGGSPWTFHGTAGIYRQDGGAAIGSLGTPDTAPQGHQAAYIIDTGWVSATVNFTHTGWYALAFNAAYGANADDFDMSFDTTWISPKEQSSDLIAYTGDHAGLGGWARNTSDLASEWGSMVFHVATAGNHTIRFVGRGQWGQYNGRVLMLDNVRIESADSIMESGFGSGQAAGQVADSNYQKQLYSQAKYARSFGLQVVAYEAGWSLGGDFTQRPLQNWCKFHDSRGTRINNTAEDFWRASGSAMQVWGVYSYWPSYSMTNVDTFPLMQSIDTFASRLPVECENGKMVPCMLRGVYRTDDVSWSYGGDRNQFRTRGDWASWLFVVPERAICILKVWTRGVSGVSVEVDGQQIKTLATSGVSDTFSTELVKGGHAVRAASTNGQVTVDSIQITFVPVSVRPTTLSMPSPRETQLLTIPTAGGWSAAAAEVAPYRGTQPASCAVASAVGSMTAAAPRAAAAPLVMDASVTASIAAVVQRLPAGVRGDGFTPPVLARTETFVPADKRWQPAAACSKPGGRDDGP